MTDTPRCADLLRDALATALCEAKDTGHAVEFQRAAIDRTRDDPRGNTETLARLCADLLLWEGAARDADIAVDEAIFKIVGPHGLTPNCLAMARWQLRADPYVAFANLGTST